MFGNLVRVSVILNCTSCTGEHTTSTITDDSPIVILNLPAGNYTVDVFAVDISIVNIETVEVIVMSEDVTTDMSPTTGPTTDGPTTESVTCKYGSYVCRYVTAVHVKKFIKILYVSDGS